MFDTEYRPKIIRKPQTFGVFYILFANKQKILSKMFIRIKVFITK